MFTPDYVPSRFLSCLSVVRRVQRELEQSRERIAASQRTLGRALERLCEADRRLRETDQGFLETNQSVNC